MRYGLSDEYVTAITETIAANKRVGQALVFGSRAKGTQRPGSDIDIALKGEDLTFNDLLSLSVALDDLDLPFQFDLVIYHRINETALLAHIDRVGQPLIPLPAARS